MDLYDDCRLINCVFNVFIGGIYSIFIIYQLIYYLYISDNFIIDQFFIIMVILMVYALIFNYLYTQTMRSQSLVLNFMLLITIMIEISFIKDYFVDSNVFKHQNNSVFDRTQRKCIIKD